MKDLPPFKPLKKGEKPYTGLNAFGIKLKLEHMPNDKVRPIRKHMRKK